jgi:hypothetical protein
LRVLGLVFVQLQSEERRYFNEHRRSHRKREGNECFFSTCPSQLPGIRRHLYALSPELVQVLACELQGASVEVACPLDRHQKRLIGGKPRVDQVLYVLAQMFFQLCNVDRIDGVLAQVAQPLGDLFLHQYRVMFRCVQGLSAIDGFAEQSVSLSASGSFILAICIASKSV